jgi:hypothetical protein
MSRPHANDALNKNITSPKYFEIVITDQGDRLCGLVVRVPAYRTEM